MPLPWILQAISLFPLGLRADAVVFNLGGGITRTLEGEIVSETAAEVVVEFDFQRRYAIAADKIAEINRRDHPVKECRKRYEEAAKAKALEPWLDLARLAKEKRLDEYEREAYRRAVEIDPENAEARKELGFVKVEGTWVTEAQARRYRDWNTKVVDMKREFSGRPWATIAPIKTAFFEMKCGSTAEVERQYLAFLQNAIFPLYNSVFPQQKFTWHNSSLGKIYIMANIEQFRDFTGVGIGTGGFFIPPRNEVFAFHGSFGIRGTTLHVLAHEACHVYQWRIFKNIDAVPTWLLEGMAVYFGDGAEFGFSFRDEPREFKPSAIKIIPPYDRVYLLKRFIQMNYYTPLARLLEVPHGAFDAGLYSNAWLVVFWCLDGEKYGAHGGEGRRLLDEYILHASTLTEEGGTNNPRLLKAEAGVFTDLVKKHLSRTLENWDEVLKRFVGDLELPQLGEWSESTRRWKGLGLDLRCPQGLKKLDQQDLLPGEIVAFGPRAGEYPRITVWSENNDFLVKVDEEHKAHVSRWIEERYAVEGEGWVNEPAAVKGGRAGMVEAMITGKRRTFVLPGQAAPKDQPAIMVRFRAAATPSRVYFFGCESPPKDFKADSEKYFDPFFEKLELTR